MKFNRAMVKAYMCWIVLTDPEYVQDPFPGTPYIRHRFGGFAKKLLEGSVFPLKFFRGIDIGYIEDVLNDMEHYSSEVIRERIMETVTKWYKELEQNENSIFEIA